MIRIGEQEHVQSLGQLSRVDLEEAAKKLAVLGLVHRVAEILERHRLNVLRLEFAFHVAFDELLQFASYLEVGILAHLIVQIRQRTALLLVDRPRTLAQLIGHLRLPVLLIGSLGRLVRRFRGRTLTRLVGHPDSENLLKNVCDTQSELVRRSEATENLLRAGDS